MMQKYLKILLSSVLALSMILMPESTTFAESTADLQQNQSGITASSNSVSADVNYDEVKKIADQKARTLTTLYGENSVQYALIDNGKIVLSGQGGYSSKESKEQPTDNTMYGIGSVSKIFTVAAIMQLVEQGKLSLDTPVVHYIPEFTMADPRYKNITVRMLINHSSGILGTTAENTCLFDDYGDCTTNLLDELKTQRLKADPGEFSVYCNDGFTLAGILIEKVTGLSYTEYLKQNISIPLNLNNTKTYQDTFLNNNLAKLYIPGSNVLPTETLQIISAGGIYSSAVDLCKFAELFMNNSTSKVLSASSVSQMAYKEYLSPLWPDEGNSLFDYGLGWDCVDLYPFNQYGIKALMKLGDTSLYHGSFTVLPEENMAVAVLSSNGTSAFNLLMSNEILLAALKAKGRIGEITADKTFSKPVSTAVPDELKKYTGYYTNYGNLIKININDDGLMTLSNDLISSLGTYKYYYNGDNKFYNADGSTYLSFVNEDNGKTYLYSSGYVTYPGLGQYANSEYLAQKIENNPISPELKTIWEKRSNKTYFLVNEKYNSQLYVLNSMLTKIMSSKNLEGYFNNAAIVDENTAITNIQIPNQYGRDLCDYVFYKTGDTEYLKLRGYITISEDSINALSEEPNFNVRINEDGYARWFKINKNSANKKIKVTLPSNSSFTAYNANGICINNSYTSHNNVVTLPAGGYIVFAGDANAEFTVNYIK